MRILIPQWQGRISPVFDVAANFLVIDVESGHEIRREERRLADTGSLARIFEFLRFGADTLICGAISAPAEVRLAAAGVRVISFTCGMVDDVLAAYLKGELAHPGFAMPGCQRWHRQKGEDIMPGGSGVGVGLGGAGADEAEAKANAEPKG
jgi:predicted Fe-Mo cluster-binding NifX family protein